MLGVIGMYTMTLTPGSVVKVWSKRYHFWHKGMVDWPDPLTGEQQVIHSDKGNFVRTTSLTEFAVGEMVHILWVPQTWEQQNSALQRMHSLDGKPYHRACGVTNGLKAAVAARDAAKVTLDLTTQQMKVGYVSYLALLNAEQAYQQAVINLVQAQSNRYTDTAALFQALGGGWWNRPDVPKS